MKLAGDLVIWEAANEDIEGIIEVLETIYLQDVAWAERAIKKLLATENYVILVAELDDQIVGFIDYYILSSIWEKWNKATINNFFIHKDYQGTGKGSSLLEEVIKRTDEIGIVELHVGTEKKNEGAIRLYKKHGFLAEYLLLERVRNTLPKEV